MTPLSESDRRLIEEAQRIAQLRYVPRWNTVGSALRTESGRTYAAMHLDAAVGRVAVCAEMIALGMAVAAGDHRLDTIVAITRRGGERWEILAPCGMCRELLSDYAPGLRVIVPAGEDAEAIGLADLLPLKREGAETYPLLGR